MSVQVKLSRPNNTSEMDQTRRLVLFWEKPVKREVFEEAHVTLTLKAGMERAMGLRRIRVGRTALGDFAQTRASHSVIVYISFISPNGLVISSFSNYLSRHALALHLELPHLLPRSCIYSISRISANLAA